MLFGLLLVLVVQFTSAEKYFEFEDIPIERYEHADAQSDSFDVELMPRSSRSLFPNFESHNLERNIPIQYDGSKLSDFEKIFQNVPIINLRKRRNAKFDEDTVKELGKPLELDVIEPENITESTIESTENPIPKQNKRSLTINDFIRFRRSSEQDDMNKDESNEDKKTNDEQRYFVNISLSSMLILVCFSQGQIMILVVFNGKPM